jgi:hypothetical protein
MLRTGQDDRVLSRQELDSQHYSAVDSTLKDLHRLSRRIKEVHDCLLGDLWLLQRLHYKGQNQHHAAMFWKRTQEIRRILRRVTGYSMNNLVEDLARECHGHELEKRQLWRIAWTQLPALNFLRDCHELMSNLLLLLEKVVFY